MDLMSYIPGDGLTHANHASRVRAWCVWANANDATPHAPTRTDVRLYVASLEGRLAPNSVAAHIASLRAVWAAMGANPNPWLAVAPRRAQPYAPRGLSRPQVNRLMRAAESGGMARDVAAICLMLCSGLRVGEVARLRVGDVTLGARSGSATIRRAKHNTWRTVPLNAETRHWLARWLAGRPAEALAIGVTTRQLGRMVRHYAQLAGVDASAHDLRHTCAHRLVEAGVSLHQVQAILGHKSIETTTIYTLPTADDLQRAVERI